MLKKVNFWNESVLTFCLLVDSIWTTWDTVALVGTCSTLDSPDSVIPAIAEALQFQFYSGVDPKQQLFDYLREKSLLLLLDNFEHLLECGELVSEMLAYAPHLKVLATSREALNLQEEWVYLVKGMAFPTKDDAPSQADYSALQLFEQSARRMRTDFSNNCRAL